MNKFPVDAPKKRVIKTLEVLGFQIVRERVLIAIIRENADGTKTPLTLPNHLQVKGSTLKTICNQAEISWEDFLRAYEQS